jgi:hypothetical protein
MNLAWFAVTCLLLVHHSGVTSAKKKAKKGAKQLFTAETLKCLVCQSLVEEINFAIDKVDPKKKVETGTFRLNSDGTQNRVVIPYARSEGHLMEIVDSVCKTFEDYAQAKTKSSGKPTIIRITTPEGNMNPRMGEVDMVPDDDLNSRLKFYCENIVEDQEDDIMQIFSKQTSHPDVELCGKRTGLCKDLTPPQEEYNFENDEL